MLGVSHATAYCTRAARGLSAIAEFLVLFGDDTKYLTKLSARNKHSTSFSCEFFSLLNLCVKNHKQSMIVNIRIHNSASVLSKDNSCNGDTIRSSIFSIAFRFKNNSGM